MESIRLFHQWFCEWEFAEFPFKKPVMFFGKIFLCLAAPSSSPTLTAIIIFMYHFHYHYHNYGLLLRIEWCLHGGS